MQIDLTSGSFLKDPRPMLEQMAAQGPLVRGRLPILGQVWFATDDATCREILKSPDRFVRDSANAGGRSMARTFWWLPPFLRPLLRSPNQIDGADHKRQRNLVGRAFARTEMEALRPEITAIADRLLDALPRPEADLVTGFARPLPVEVICLLLGIPEADRPRVIRDSGALGQITGIWSFFRAMPGLYRLTRYFRSELKRLKAEGGAGLLAEMVQVEEDGMRLSDDEVLALAVALFIAGHETTASLIAWAAAHLLSHPDTADHLRQDPAGLPLFVEEVMRWQNPVYLTNMIFVAKDTEIAGHSLKRGDRVVPLLIAANRDAARFDAPWSFEPARRPNPHLGFGHGPHVCIEMQLARIEAQVAISRLLARYPEARIQGDPEALPMQRRIGLRGLAALPVRTGPAPES